MMENEKDLTYLIQINDIMNKVSGIPKEIIEFVNLTHTRDYLKNNRKNFILMLDDNIYQYPMIISNKKGLELRRKYEIENDKFRIFGKLELELTKEEREGLEISLKTPNFDDVLGYGEFIDEEDKEQFEIEEQIKRELRNNGK